MWTLGDLGIVAVRIINVIIEYVCTGTRVNAYVVQTMPQTRNLGGIRMQPYAWATYDPKT